MDDKWGTLIYLIILAIIGISGALRKKRKPGVKPGEAAQQKEEPSILEKLITGGSMADVLLQDEERTERAEEPEVQEITDEPVKPEQVEYEKMVVPEGKGYDWDMDTEDSLLSSEDEGVSVFRHETRTKKAYDIMEEHMGSDEEMPCMTLADEIMQDFDLRKAVIYSEILGRKYF